MKIKYLILMAAILFSVLTAPGQSRPTPPGASKFIRSVGGLSPDGYQPSFFEEMTHGNIDKVFAGGGPGDWTELGDRIFLTRKWSIEIGEISQNYNTSDLHAGIMAAMRKQLEAEGFKVSPETLDSSSIRYEKGSTAGSLEFLSHFLSSGNVPLKLDFIFYESYLRNSTPSTRTSTPAPKKSNVKVVKRHTNSEPPPKPIPPPKQP